METKAEYYLPFDRTKNPVKIMQGWNGPWSHKIFRQRASECDTDLRFAVDFELPLRSRILASRSGTVLGLMDRSKVFYEGVDPEIGNNLPLFSTNLLLIRHDDDTTAAYSHLEYEGVVVKTGQRVVQGQLVAYTGLSGWVGDVPHLHFQVNRRTEIIPVTFVDYAGPLEHSELFPGEK